MTAVPPSVAAPASTSVMPWWVPIVRAAVAVAAAIVATFTGGHSAQFGLLLFTGWAAATAISDLIAWRMLPAGRARTVSLGRAIVGLLAAAITALAAAGLLGPLDEVSRTAALALTAAAALLVGGMLEAGLGVTTKTTDAYSRDWMTAGVIQVIAAVLIMFVSPSLEQRFQVEGIEGVVTGAIVVTGLLGVTAAVLGVLLALAGFSLRRGRDAAPATGGAPAGDATGRDGEEDHAAGLESDTAPDAAESTPVSHEGEPG